MAHHPVPGIEIRVLAIAFYFSYADASHAYCLQLMFNLFQHIAANDGSHFSIVHLITSVKLSAVDGYNTVRAALQLRYPTVPSDA